MANAKERVKDFPSIVGSIQSDDYIPVDGTTQGTRKVQVQDIMEAPITGLDTSANTIKGAVNEVATTAGKVWVGTQDEYDDLPDTKLTDHVLHCITDGEPTSYDAIWDKVGTSALQTVADNCSDAINELNGKLVKFKAIHIDDTTNNNGVIVITNPFGVTTVSLLTNTYLDGVSSSYGTIAINSINASEIGLRFRTLKDGTPNSNTAIDIYVMMVDYSSF